VIIFSIFFLTKTAHSLRYVRIFVGKNSGKRNRQKVRIFLSHYLGLPLPPICDTLERFECITNRWRHKVKDKYMYYYFYEKKFAPNTFCESKTSHHLQHFWASRFIDN